MLYGLLAPKNNLTDPNSSRDVHHLSSEVPDMNIAIIAACCQVFGTSRKGHTVNAAAQSPFF